MTHTKRSPRGIEDCMAVFHEGRQMYVQLDQKESDKYRLVRSFDLATVFYDSVLYNMWAERLKKDGHTVHGIEAFPFEG